MLTYYEKMQKCFQTNGEAPSRPPRKVFTVLMFDKINFNPKLVRRTKDHCMLIKRPNQEEDIKILSINTPNMDAFNFLKQTVLDMKSQIDPNKISKGSFNNTLQIKTEKHWS